MSDYGNNIKNIHEGRVFNCFFLQKNSPVSDKSLSNGQTDMEPVKLDDSESKSASQELDDNDDDLFKGRSIFFIVYYYS